MTEPTVFVVDDDEGVRDALALHLDLAGLRVRTFSSADAFLTMVGPEDSGCAVLDIRMPGMDGLALQAEMTRQGIALPVIIITGHGDVPAAVTAFRAGAVDFLQKPFDEDRLIDRVREAIDRDTRDRHLRQEQDDARTRANALSPREREVMLLIADGLSNKHVALHLDIGVRTVETHRARVMEKMGVSSVSELARLALLLTE